MLLFADPSPVPPGYRFVTRVTGRVLPSVPKVLHLRCTLSAANHTVVGIRTASMIVGETPRFEELVELVHEPAADGVPPKYFELVATVVVQGGEPLERRLAGIMDHAQPVIVLPPILLEGRRP